MMINDLVPGVTIEDPGHGICVVVGTTNLNSNMQTVTWLVSNENRLVKSVYEKRQPLAFLCVIE